MDEDKLNRLIMAIETKQKTFYYGDIRESILDALKDLREAQEQLGEIKDVLNID